MSLTSAAVAAGATIVDECQGWHPGKWSNLVIEGDWGHLGNRVIEGCSVGRGHNNLRGGDRGLGQGFGSSAWDDLDDLLDLINFFSDFFESVIVPLDPGHGKGLETAVVGLFSILRYFFFLGRFFFFLGYNPRFSW